jgi:hypothetical protein
MARRGYYEKRTTLFDRLFGDPAVEESKRASERRRAERMGRSKSAARGRSAPAAPAPYTCGARCDWNGLGTTCQSTVRGGVCPCRYC